MIYTPDFSGIWAKLDRAKTHRDALHDEVGVAFETESNRIVLSVEYDDESGYHIFRADTVPEDLLRRWGVIVGDAIHNLRGALDHLVWQLSLHKREGRKPRNPGTVKFPICKVPDPELGRPEDFRGGKKEALWDVLPRHRAIIEDSQPYKRWHGLTVHPLVRLNAFSNTDKHQVVNPVLGLTETFVVYDAVFNEVGGEIVVTTFQTESGPIERDAEVTRVLVRPPSLQRNVKVAGDLTPLVCFPDLPGQAIDLTDALDQIAVSVTNIVRKFEPLP